MKLITEVFIGSLTGKAQLEQRNILEKFRDKDIHNNIKIAIAPNMINKELLKMFKEYGVTTIELEIQSTNSYILKKCGFDYTMEDIKKATKMIKWNRFKVSFQVGVGLPESNKIDEQNTAKELAKLKPNIVRVYPMVVMNGTKLKEEFERGIYEPLTLNQAIERCKEVIYVFSRKKIKQINIVKQKDLDTSDETGIVAGPYHEQFAQFVTDSIWYDSIVEKIKKYNVKVKKVKVEVNPKDLTSILGYENENANKLQEFYDVEIKPEGNPEIKPGKSKLTILEVYSN